MPVLISLLQGVNLGPHRRMSMERLRGLYESLGFEEVRSFIQSGNVVFKTAARNPAAVQRRIEEAIRGEFGFHADVVVRTVDEWKKVVEANPFAGRSGIEPAKFLVSFLAAPMGEEARKKVLTMADGKEEVHLVGREMFLYFPDGLARPKISFAAIGKAAGVPVTARNWNTVLKLLEIAESLQ